MYFQPIVKSLPELGERSCGSCFDKISIKYCFLMTFNRNPLGKKLASPLLVKGAIFKKFPCSSQKIFLPQIFSNTTYHVGALVEKYGKLSW